MRFIEKLPVKIVEQIDFDALFNRIISDIDDDYHLPLTYSQRVNLGVWLRREHPEYKLITRQLGPDYKMQHPEPRNYVIRLVLRG